MIPVLACAMVPAACGNDAKHGEVVQQPDQPASVSGKSFMLHIDSDKEAFEDLPSTVELLPERVRMPGGEWWHLMNAPLPEGHRLIGSPVWRELPDGQVELHWTNHHAGVLVKVAPSATGPWQGTATYHVDIGGGPPDPSWPATLELR
jgi:hypothetical protein